MFAKYLSCLAALLLCTGSGQAEDPSARQQLRWMGHWKNRGLREQLVREVRDEFQFLHQDTDIHLTFAADLMPNKSKELTGILIAEMIRAGRIDWDVIYMDPAVYHTVAKELNDPEWGQKHLVDFSQFPDIKAAHKPFLVEGPNCHTGTGGMFVGPYIEGFYACLWYNMAVAEKLGVNIKEMNMSTDDFLGYLSRVNDYNRTAEVPVSGIATFKWPGITHRFAYNLYLSEHLAHPKTPDEKILEKILRFFETMNSYNPVFATIPDDAGWRGAAQLLMDDRALFMIEPTWRYSSLKASFPDLLKKIHPAQLPGFEKQSFYVGGFIPTWAVMKNSPARDTGIELMRFWCSPEIAQRWVRYTKCPTGLAGNLYDSEYGLDRLARFQKKLTSERTPQTDVMFFEEGMSPLAPIWDCILPVAHGEMTANEALNKMKGNEE